MSYFKEDYKSFINKQIFYDYTIIDPPWNFNNKIPCLSLNQLTYNLWNNNIEDMKWVFNNINTNNIYI